MALTTDPATAAAFSDGDVIYARAFDVSIDGDADADTGNVQGAIAITVASGKASALTDMASGTWDTTAKALIYYFD